MGCQCDQKAGAPKTEKVEEVLEKEVVLESHDLDKELQFKIDLIIGNNITGPSQVISEVKVQDVGGFQEIGQVIFYYRFRFV